MQNPRGNPGLKSVIALLLIGAALITGCSATPAPAAGGATPPTPSAVLGTPVIATATLAPIEAPTASPLPPTDTSLPATATALPTTSPTTSPIPPTPVPPTLIPPTTTAVPPTPQPPTLIPPTATAVPPTPQPAPGSAVEAEVLALLNEARAAAGCATPLAPAPELTAAAERHSRDMAARDFVGHTGSDSSNPGRRIEEAGYRFRPVGAGEPLWAENVAAGFPDAASVVQSWLDSPGHRTNILTCGFTEAGVAVTEQPGTEFTTYWANVFAAGR